MKISNTYTIHRLKGITDEQWDELGDAISDLIVTIYEEFGVALEECEGVIK
jgi:hypothetical protein